MDKDNKLCIICCLPFVLNGQQQNHEKISAFCEEIRNDVDRKSNNGEKGQRNVFDSSEEILKLDNRFGMSACYTCFPKITELLTSKENMRKLENHVIVLQMEIIKGLRDLQECMEHIKCQHDTLKKKIGSSNEFSLRRRLTTEEEVDCLAFKLRKWISKDLQLNGKVKGNLWICESDDERVPAEQAIVKLEVEDTALNFDEDDASNASWDASDDIDEKPAITTDSKCKRSERRTPQNVQVRKTSAMTLRTRSSKILREEIPRPSSLPTLPAKSKWKKKPKVKQTSKPILKLDKKKAHVPRPVRQCDLCSFGTRMIPSFEQHMRLHENEANPQSKSLECPHCPSKFSTQQFFNFHQKCHQGSYKMCCEICSKMIPALSLADHLNSHNFPENPPLKIIHCQNCYYCCTSRQAYVAHLLRHTSTTTKGKFTCDICSGEFSMLSGLLDHFEGEHKESVKKLPCNFPGCAKLFPSSTYLIAHKKGHLKEKTIPCPGCDKKFASKKLLQYHSRVHSDEKEFGCDLCDKRFRWKPTLIDHQRTQHGAGKLKCKKCGKEFPGILTLSYHMREAHGHGILRFPCELCGVSFKSKYSLRNHFLSRHEEGYKYSCDECGKGFKTRTGLHLHSKMHGGEKNWKCEYCGKGFLRKENLRDHLRTHTGERPYVCEICGKDFNQASALKTHKKNQHSS